MSANKINDNMGKKIVEALKMQNGDSIETSVDDVLTDGNSDLSDKTTADDVQANDIQTPDYSQADNQLEMSVEDAFNKSLARNLANNSFSYEYTGNVSVLVNLMNKLPAGVSRQTAALIIAQTLEALGITMNSVLNEAEDVQNSLASKVRECQKNIIDYRNQISDLENQVQQYQRQVVKLGDIMSLFSKTGT